MDDPTPHIDPAAVQRRIRNAREGAGLSVQQLADLVEHHPNTVKNWEGRGGDPSIPYREIDRIAEALNVTPLWILWGSKALVTMDATELLEDVRDSLRRIERTLIAALVEEGHEVRQRPPSDQLVGAAGRRSQTPPQR
jgi:transcriptional regulator with XRE-family HTH domain